MGDKSAWSESAAADVATHEAKTHNVHGIPDTSLLAKLADIAALPALEQAADLARATALPRNALLQAMPGAAIMGAPPTFGARVTGLTPATEAANTTVPGSARYAPLYDTPRDDQHYRITGAFGRLNGNAGFDVGACQSTRPGGLIGPTGMMGVYEFELPATRYWEWWGRDTGGTQYVVMWVSKDGGPFKPHVDPGTPRAMAAPGDNSYFLQPVDMGAVANWRIILEGEAFTFGGVRSAGAVNYPAWPARRLLVLGDSYSVRGAGIGSTGYPLALARALGLQPHISGYGGTGISAVNGDGANYYKYADRLAAEVTPFFGDEHPAAIFVQGSINDGDYGFAGTPQFDADVDALLGKLQAAYPSSLIFTSRPMHPYRGDAVSNANDATIGDQIEAAADARGIAVYDAVTDIPLTGTGYAGHVTGDGNSDTYSAADHQHPTPAGSKALALGPDFPAELGGIAGFVNKTAVLVRPFTQAFTPRKTVSVTNFAAPYRLLKTAYQRFDAQAANAGIALQENGSASIGSASSGKALFYLIPADFDIAGYLTRFKLRLAIFTNDVAPGCNFSAWISQISSANLSGGAAAVNVAAGAQVAGSVANINAPAADSVNRADTADFALPGPGPYLMAIAVAAPGMAGNSSAVVRLELYVHNV